MKIFFSLLVLFFVSIPLLEGCGQSGKLYLPQQKTAANHQVPHHSVRYEKKNH